MKKFHLLHYVENCSSKLKEFKTLKALDSFVASFQKKHKGSDDFWIDYAVTGVTGKLVPLDESCPELE